MREKMRLSLSIVRIVCACYKYFIMLFACLFQFIAFFRGAQRLSPQCFRSSLILMKCYSGKHGRLFSLNVVKNVRNGLLPPKSYANILFIFLVAKFVFEKVVSLWRNSSLLGDFVTESNKAMLISAIFAIRCGYMDRGVCLIKF